MKIVTPSVKIEAITPNPLELIERAGRTCYQSEPRGDPEAFVRMLIRRGHESVLEHAAATFRIICDRGVSHELVRHRIASYSQESTRYCSYGDEITVIRPQGIDGVEWLEAMYACEQAYLSMLRRGVSAQVARSVLPNSLKTEVVMTANFREWRHFLKLRTAPAAHPDMRLVAGLIRKCFEIVVPIIVEDL